MSLDLDDRQRAMLAEMGVRVWWPDHAAPAAEMPGQPMALVANPVVAPAAAPVAAASPVSGHGSVTAPVPLPVTASVDLPAPVTAAPPLQQPVGPVAPAVAERVSATPQAVKPGTPAPNALTPLPSGIEQLDWPALQSSVAGCQACAMCLGRRSTVLAPPPGAGRADWLVLGEPPDDAQERAGLPFVDDAGLLLDNMLKAVGVARCPAATGPELAPAQSAYLSLVLKCRPALPTAPDAQALASCAHFLRREIALVQPKVILVMGRLAMQVLLSQDHPQGLKLPLGKLRGQVWHYQGVPVVVTYPPAYLLRNGLDKARAWEDLCLASDVAQGRGTGA